MKIYVKNKALTGRDKFEIEKNTYLCEVKKDVKIDTIIKIDGNLYVPCRKVSD